MHPASIGLPMAQQPVAEENRPPGGRQNSAASVQSIADLHREREGLMKSSNPTVKRLAEYLANFEEKRLALGGISKELHEGSCQKVIRAALALMKSNLQPPEKSDVEILKELDLDPAKSSKLEDWEFEAISQHAVHQAAGIVEGEIIHRTHAEQRLKSQTSREAQRRGSLLGIFRNVIGTSAGASSSRAEEAEEPQAVPREWMDHALKLVRSEDLGAHVAAHALADLWTLRVRKDIDRPLFEYNVQVIGKAAAMLAGRMDVNETILAQAGMPGPDEKISPQNHEMIEQYQRCVLHYDSILRVFRKSAAPGPVGSRSVMPTQTDMGAKKAAQRVAELYMRFPQLQHVQGHPMEREVLSDVENYGPGLLEKGYSPDMIVGLAASFMGRMAIKVLHEHDHGDKYANPTYMEEAVLHLEGTHWQKIAAAVAAVKVYLLRYIQEGAIETGISSGSWLKEFLPQRLYKYAETSGRMVVTDASRCIPPNWSREPYGAGVIKLAFQNGGRLFSWESWE